MWDLIIIMPFSFQPLLLELLCSMWFIVIWSLRIEFEVGVKTPASTKGSACEEGVLGLDCGPKLWQASDSPMHCGDVDFILSRCHGDQFK